MLEAVFIGTHVSDFAGLSATGLQVRMPYSMAYDVVEDLGPPKRVICTARMPVRPGPVPEAPGSGQMAPGHQQSGEVAACERAWAWLGSA
jgi:hypothetical protein